MIFLEGLNISYCPGGGLVQGPGLLQGAGSCFGAGAGKGIAGLGVSGFAGGGAGGAVGASGFVAGAGLNLGNVVR